MSSPHILILAAGQGKRMYSDLPKVLHAVHFRPMLHYVLDLAESLPHASISVIVGHGEAMVREACTAYKGLQFFNQPQQLGTGDAVRKAEPFLSKQKGQVVILSGDVPMLKKCSLDKLLATPEADCVVMTAELADPTGYGRVLHDKAGHVTGIREQADCSEDEKKLREVNSGIYRFEISALLGALKRVENHNQQGEFYLTDVVGFLAKEGKVLPCRLEDPREMAGINDRYALSQVEAQVREGINREWMLKGVSIQNPATVIIDRDSKFGKDVVIEQGCQIFKCEIGDGTHIKQGSYLTESKLGKDCTVGPFAHLRPGSVLRNKVKIGNFVEVKKSEMKDGAKASHLSYIGDAEIGENSNLGCGFITCNYDGKNKHKTTIERDVFVGSDTQVVAPLTIGAGSYVASGSTVTKTVPPDSLVFSRGRQTTKVGGAKKFRDK